MTAFARTTRLSAVAALALAGFWFSGCSEARRLELRCFAGNVQVCIQLGDMYAQGKGVPQDFGRAASAYAHACDSGAFDICNTLGEIVEQTGAVEGGMARAEQLYSRACEGGSSPGCLNLGLVAASREDFVRAFALYEKSCEGGWAAGCHHVAASYEAGEGVSADMAKAVAFYNQACDGEFIDSCTTLANHYLAGEKLPRNIEAALNLYGKALKVYVTSCDAGNQRDCDEADQMRNRVAVIAAIRQAEGQRGPAPPDQPRIK